ncbi:MAG: YIP1 family protein [Acidimicrobiia bacterium]
MESVQKAIRLTFFDQRTARQVMFEHSATADAVMIVAAVNAIVLLVLHLRVGSFDLLAILEGTIRGLAGWLFLSFAIWLMGTKLLKGNGDPQTVIRTSGFASLPLLLGALTFVWGGLSWVGLLWHLALLVLVAKVSLGLEWIEAAAAVALGAALIYLIQTLLGAAFFRF